MGGNTAIVSISSLDTLSITLFHSMAYLILLLLVVAYSEYQCPVTVVEGYLKRYCNTTETFQCMASDQKYRVRRTFHYRRINYGVEFSGEVGWYQACGVRRPVGYTRQFTTDVRLSAPYCGYLCSTSSQDTDFALVQDTPCQGDSSEMEGSKVHGVTFKIDPNSTCNGVCDNSWDIEGQGILNNNWCLDEIR